MLHDFFYFEGTTTSLDKIKVDIGQSVVSGDYSLCGKALDLSIENGCLVIYSQGNAVAKTGKLDKKVSLIQEAELMPFKRVVGGKNCSSQQMLVFSTENGSLYSFIPTGARLYEV